MHRYDDNYESVQLKMWVTSDKDRETGSKDCHA